MNENDKDVFVAAIGAVLLVAGVSINSTLLIGFGILALLIGIF